MIGGREKAWRGDRVERRREEGLEREVKPQKPWEREERIKGKRRRVRLGFHKVGEDGLRGILF